MRGSVHRSSGLLTNFLHRFVFKFALVDKDVFVYTFCSDASYSEGLSARLFADQKQRETLGAWP